MLMISISGYFDFSNAFKVKEVYVSDESEVYILKSSESFVPYKYNGTVSDLFDSIKNCYYPAFSMSNVRVHEDNDAKALSNFLMQKINQIDMKKPGSEKILFDVISGFGDELK
jgi:hypothetical protein